ncbi:hypothetical protein FHS02_004154 [Massilia umbonata]|uniref:Uncharacterized protein n=1 Tax=Pseudoduganella umbonata TaxID=864828 RepID=A0A7W5EDW4_9BURK|nr:hypothetical protein [Pseudoduganella umbonata]
MQLDRRKNVVLAHAIDDAIALDGVKGGVHAWAALAALGLHENTIRRLLDVDGRSARRTLPISASQTPLHHSTASSP